MWRFLHRVIKHSLILTIFLYLSISLASSAPSEVAVVKMSNEEESTKAVTLTRKDDNETPDKESAKKSGKSKTVSLSRRQQAVGSMLGSAAALPYFGAQSAMNGLGNFGNSLYNNLAYAGYGIANGLSNLGMGVQNGFQNGMMGLQSSAYGMPYYNSLNNPYSTASQMFTNPMSMLGQQPMNPYMMNQNPMQSMFPGQQNPMSMLGQQPMNPYMMNQNPMQSMFPGQQNPMSMLGQQPMNPYMMNQNPMQMFPGQQNPFMGGQFPYMGGQMTQNPFMASQMNHGSQLPFMGQMPQTSYMG